MSGPKQPPELPLLARVIANDPQGCLCFHRSAAFVFEVPGAILMLGTISPADRSERLPTDSAVPFIHAWAEFRGKVYAPTTIERMGGQLIGQSRAGYYAVNGIHDTRSISRAELLRLDRRLGLKAALRRGGLCRGGASFGGSLLDAVGLAWKESSDGGVIPAHVIEGEAE